MSYVKGEAPGQSSLLPVSLDELIPADHLVRVIEAYVAQLDMAELGFARAVTKTTGRPPYDPADLLKLYLYGYLHRIRSSRRPEAGDGGCHAARLSRPKQPACLPLHETRRMFCR